MALFQTASATFQSLHFTNATVTGGSSVAVVVSSASNSTFTDMTVHADIRSNASSGIVVGTANGSTFTQVHTSGTNWAQDGSGSGSTRGGITASTSGVFGPTFTLCSSSATIRGSQSGGLTGSFGSDLSIDRSGFEGTVEGSNIGGLVGSGGFFGSLEITDSYVVATFEGTGIGGLVSNSYGDVDVVRSYARINAPNSGALVYGLAAVSPIENSPIELSAADSFVVFDAVNAGTTFYGLGRGYGQSPTVAATNIYYDVPRPANGCFTGFPSAFGFQCTETTLGASSYFVASAAPMNATWDFASVWFEATGRTPSLHGLPFATPAPTDCLVGAPYDWDGNGIEDGCRGSVDTIDPSVEVPAGTQTGDGVMILSGATLSTGVVLYNDVVVASRAAIGPDVHVLSGTVVQRGASIGARSTIGADSVIGRNAVVGADNELGSASTLGYASTTGDHVSVDTALVLGNLATLGHSGALPGAVDCVGPLVLARSSSIAADAPGTFSCTGSVVVGPATHVGTGGAFGADIRLRKNGLFGDNITVGDNVRIGRDADIRSGVTIEAGSNVGAGVSACGPVSGVVPRAATIGVCD